MAAKIKENEKERDSKIEDMHSKSVPPGKFSREELGDLITSSFKRHLEESEELKDIIDKAKKGNYIDENVHCIDLALLEAIRENTTALYLMALVQNMMPNSSDFNSKSDNRDNTISAAASTMASAFTGKHLR